MSVLNPKKTYQNLKKKGFTDAINKSKDHKRLEFYHEGKFILQTKISHGNSEIDEYLIKQMSVQCKLSKTEFMDLANCPMSKRKYLKILESKKLLQ